MCIYNIVWYDGVNAYVNKFILNERTAKKDIVKYFSDINVEVLKLDKLYRVTFENIFAFKENNKEIYDRFISMYEK